MNVFIRKHKKHSPPEAIKSSAYFDGAIGFWGTVTNVNSCTNTVDVKSNLGFVYAALPVASPFPVAIKSDDEGVKRTCGERNLPQPGSYVFVLTPYGSQDGAFVLCYALPYSCIDETLIAKNKGEKSEKDTSRDSITQGGWHINEAFKDGAIKIENADKSIAFEAKEKGVTFAIKKDDNCTVEASVKDGGVTLDAKTDDNTSVNVSIADGEVSVTATGAISIESANSEKITIKNNAIGALKGTSLGKLVDALLTELINIETVGSPALHKGSPAFIANITQIQNDWKMVFDTQ